MQEAHSLLESDLPVEKDWETSEIVLVIVVEALTNQLLEGPPQLLVETAVELHNEGMEVAAGKTVDPLDVADVEVSEVDADAKVVGADIVNVLVQLALAAVEPLAERRVEARVVHDERVNALAAQTALLHLDRDESETLKLKIATDLVDDVQPLAALVDGVFVPELAADHVGVRVGLDEEDKSVDGVLDLRTCRDERKLELEAEAVHHVADDVFDGMLAQDELVPEVASGEVRLDRQGRRSGS
ncbi:hypothetical protein F4774DRAFT_429176 [Daldinia eschscholtzii]|nr:hypothetical protein F4774DRAFT_429176 [Daldinia eschscholtzii]